MIANSFTLIQLNFIFYFYFMNLKVVCCGEVRERGGNLFILADLCSKIDISWKKVEKSGLKTDSISLIRELLWLFHFLLDIVAWF